MHRCILDPGRALLANASPPLQADPSFNADLPAASRSSLSNSSLRIPSLNISYALRSSPINDIRLSSEHIGGKIIGIHFDELIQKADSPFSLSALIVGECCTEKRIWRCILLQHFLVITESLLHRQPRHYTFQQVLKRY